MIDNLLLTFYGKRKEQVSYKLLVRFHIDKPAHNCNNVDSCQSGSSLQGLVYHKRHINMQII